MKKLVLLALTLSAFEASATYSHLAKLTSSGSAASTTAPRAGMLIGIQCDGTARFAFGVTTATPNADQGLRILADQPPVIVDLLSKEDAISMIREGGAGTVNCWITDATF